MKTADRFDAVRSLERALAALGVHASRWALVEACEGDASLASFASCARKLGLHASLRQVGAGDLTFLPSGTLVELTSGAIVTVVSHGQDGVVIEHVDGARERVGRRSASQPTLALELRRSARHGAGLVSRLAARLRHEPHFARAVVLASFFAVVLLGLGLAGPILTREALASALPDRARSELGVLAAALALVAVQVSYVGWLRRRALLYLSTKLSEIASVDVVAHLLELPFSTLQRMDVAGAHQAARAATGASEALPALAEQTVDALLGIGFLAYAATIDPASASVAGAAGALLVVFGVASGRRRMALRSELLARTRAQRQVLYETIAGIETVKSESAEARMLTQWLDRLVAEEERALAVRFQDARFSVVMEAVQRLVFSAVLLYMAKRCLAGGASVADLVAAIQASAGFLVNMDKLARLPPALSTFAGDVQLANDALRERAGDAPEVGRSRPPADATAPAIVLRDVWFRYDEQSPWVLRGVDLVVRDGETAVLAWPSGGGKSTLLRIVSGLVPPTRGDALVYGMDAAKTRAMVTYVPQHATLFPSSILENLRILSGNARTERILAAARATGLMAIVETWPMALETVVSLGGSNVSSGQRQLVLFTAAVASETPIVLLDEALAHVDLRRRARLADASLFRGRTVIAVVHDASSRETASARVIDVEATLVGDEALAARGANASFERP